MKVAAGGKVVFLTGKGGTGKTTVALALAGSLARLGRQTALVALEEVDHLADHCPAVRVERVDPNVALLEWLSELGGRLAAKLLHARSSFRLFAAAAPGARELLALSRIAELRKEHELVIVDGPASGHARALWRAPATVAGIARMGPIAARARELGQLLASERHSAFLVVARPVELAISETVELADQLRGDLGRRFEAVIVNGVVKRRFTAAELELPTTGDRVVAEAVAAARRTTARYRRERRQIARLRRAGLEVVELPLLAGHSGLGELAAELGRPLADLTRSLAG